MRNKFLCSILLLAAIAKAQAPPSPPTTNPAATANLQPVPTLDELSKTKLELLSTKMALLNTQEATIRQQGQQLQLDMQQQIIAIETKYPGFTISQQTGQLVAKPAQPSPGVMGGTGQTPITVPYKTTNPNPKPTTDNILEKPPVQHPK
jgi:hypothetical protein